MPQTTNIHIVIGQTHAAHLHRQDLSNSHFSSIDQQNNTKPLSFFKTEHSMFLQLIIILLLCVNTCLFKQYTFILQTSSDVIDLTDVFYQKIFQHILNGNFVLNKGILKGTFWAQVKYDKIHMCVELVYSLTLCMSIFIKISCWTINW